MDYILCSQRWKSSIQSAKTRLGAACASDHELLITKFRLKLKKVGKTSRPFRYDLNQIPFLMRWPKYWSFRFNIIPSNEIPGQISFRVDWMDLLAVQGTLKSLLQHHNSKASISSRIMGTMIILMP